MPSSDPIQRFQDILDNISRIENHIAGIDFRALTDNGKTRDAVERCLEELVKRLKSLEIWHKRFALIFHGQNCADSETFCGMNMIASTKSAYGTWSSGI